MFWGFLKPPNLNVFWIILVVANGLFLFVLFSSVERLKALASDSKGKLCVGLFLS